MSYNLKNYKKTLENLGSSFNNGISKTANNLSQRYTNAVNNLKQNETVNKVGNAVNTAKSYMTNGVKTAADYIKQLTGSGVGVSGGATTGTQNTRVSNMPAKTVKRQNDAGYTEKEKSESTSTTNTVDENWKKIQQQIQMSTMNSKNEIANAQRQATKNMENYLRALGIEGTGLGQSAYVDMATKYANQLADINAEEQSALMEAETEYNDKIANEVKELIEMEADDETINQYMQFLKDQGESTATLEAYKNAFSKAKLEEELDEEYDTFINAVSIGANSAELSKYADVFKGTKYEKFYDALTSSSDRQFSEAEEEEMLALVQDMVSGGAYADRIWETVDVLKERGVPTEDIEMYLNTQGYAPEDALDDLYQTISSMIGTGKSKLSDAELNQFLARINSAKRTGDDAKMKEAYEIVLKGYRTDTPLEKVVVNNPTDSTAGVSTAVSNFLKDRYQTLTLDDLNDYLGTSVSTSHTDVFGDKIGGAKAGILGDKSGSWNPFYWGRDDDFSVQFNGSERHIDVDWWGGGGNGIADTKKFDEQKGYLKSAYKPTNDTFIIYKNRLWYYNKEQDDWGIVHNTGDGKKIYDDMVEAAKNGTW